MQASEWPRAFGWTIPYITTIRIKLLLQSIHIIVTHSLRMQDLDTVDLRETR